MHTRSQHLAFSFAYLYGVCFRKHVKLYKECGFWNVRVGGSKV